MSSTRRSLSDDDDNLSPRRRARQRSSVELGNRGSNQGEGGNERPLGSSTDSGSAAVRRPSRLRDELEASTHSGSSQDRRANRAHNAATRAERVGRVVDGSEEASAKSGRSGHGGSSTVNHEDEIERIREIRARRLRHERLERGEKDEDSRSPVRGEGRRAVDHRVKRRELREAKAKGDGVTEPRHFRSTPPISRKELEDAGIVRRDRPRRGEHSPKPSRTKSARPRDLSPTKDDDGSVYSRSKRNDDDASAYSRRARRERSERIVGESHGDSRRERGEIEDRLAARRARRKGGAEDLAGSNSTPSLTADEISLDELRNHQDRPKAAQRASLSSLQSPLPASSAHSAISGASTATEGSFGRSPRGEKKSPSRRRPPGRSKSADAELLAMGQQKPEETDIADREARRRERQQLRMQASEPRSTDLTTRLRERREARAAEREAANAKTAGTSAVERPATIQDRVQTAPSISPTAATAQADKSLLESEPDETKNEEPTVPENIEELELETGSGDDSPNWSVRIRVISAVDLPLNVVPNMPLCPVLKVGLLKLPADSSSDPSAAVTRKLGNNSIEIVRSARVRSTTSKILSKRDNGTIDFHQELRWDDVKNPTQVALFVELSARASRTPQNIKESPPPLSQDDAFRVPLETDSSGSVQSSPTVDANGDPMRILNRNASSEASTTRGFGAFWKRATNQKQAELEAAEAAAAVARMIIEQAKTKNEDPSQTENSEPASFEPAMKITTSPQSDYAVTLQGQTEKSLDNELTEDIRLGTLLIPLTNLPLDMAINGSKIARLEQWYQVEKVDDLASESSGWKKPSVQLEITFSSPDRMNKSEDELKYEEIEDAKPPPSPAKRMSMMNPSFVKKATEEVNAEDPVLEPGVIDFISVVGCRDIGIQTNASGRKGWVESTPESVIFEQFPPDNEFHRRAGRSALLPEMVQWFCFPEGCRLWRGTGPPSHTDLNLKRFSASSPPNVASSLATFDACLNCTTSFSWFVISSNSDEYGSKLVKTYGAVIRFYAPAPLGIDPTQEDFAQGVLGNQKRSPAKGLVKRLWVPVGICLTSNLPVIGIMEAILLRLCEELVAKVGNSQDNPPKLDEIRASLANLIVNFQKPIAGAVNCSIPFLSGHRFLLSLPPSTGLPSLPHGRSVVSVCRLLGAEGLNFLLAAVLTECKILIHSQDIADIAMVAEVVTALAYPFSWSLPYIPILPLGMIEFVEAPLSFILGIPTCNLQLVEPYALEELVVIDLDNGFSPVDYYEGNRKSSRVERRGPTHLPANVATNISKAWYRLLRAEEEVEEQFGNTMLGEQSLPRLEPESFAEREFRISVAIEICSLLRGYDECIGPVFNRDKFLKISPALFEETTASRGVGGALTSRGANPNQKSISPRSKRFLSLLVNTQNFHQLLESLESEDEASLFHEIMDLFEDTSSDNTSSSRVDTAASKAEKYLSQLSKTLQKAEDKIPTYLVDQANDFDSDDIYDDDLFGDDGDDGFPNFDELKSQADMMSSSDGNMISSFVDTLLAPIDCPPAPESPSDSGANAVSMEYIQKLESTPWEYQSMFRISVDGEGDESLAEVKDKVKLRDAIGERRFRAWKMAQDQKAGGEVDLAFISDNLRASKQSSAIDLNSLISSATSDTSETLSISSDSSSLRSSTLTPEQQRVADAKNRDVIRRCLDKANVGNEKRYGNQAGGDNPFLENGRDLMEEAEKALRNPSAQRFLLSILAQRSRLENQRARTMRHRQSTVMSSVSRLDTKAFEGLVRLSCAMLDSCMEYNEYEPGYRLLTHTAGFIMVLERDDDEEGDGEMTSKHIVSMTSRIGLHPFYADLGVWKAVMALHLRGRQSGKRSEATSSDDESEDEEDEGELEYEAAVATLYEMVGYGIPGEELSRFAMRASEEHGWFCDDRGRQLLMLARRISVRRDQADLGGACDTGDIELIRKGQDGGQAPPSIVQGAAITGEKARKWVDVGWCHPAAPSSVLKQDAKVSDSMGEYMKRSPVTALASFGSSVVATGGLDGSVFVAHSISDGRGDKSIPPEVRGIHLDWGSASRASAGSSSDGVYGVGAVSCLAASYGNGHHVATQSKKDTADGENYNDIVLASMEGSRVVAGTTAGDLRVWSVKDVYSAVLELKKGEVDDMEVKSMFGGGNSSTRLKFSLRGRALSGHRGGVTCIDVPSPVYRPDALVTGGADGLIKLWSLRAPTSGRRSSVTPSQEPESSGPRSRGGDALDVLSGHNGRVMCVQSAWHGDRLLSGGADRTLRVWDLAGSGKCLHRLTGHSGWVTMVKYWGPNTIVSASSDRSVALWDARVRDSPLFTLRHHHSPISDLLVGSRTDPMMVTSAADGTVATWDFRTLSASKSSENSTSDDDSKKNCQVVRLPAATMRHGRDVNNKKTATGSVKLARGFKNLSPSILSVGSDAIVREWDMSTGKLFDESPTGHCDAITSFSSFGQSFGMNTDMHSPTSLREGMLTSSWDGTIQMRRFVNEE
jgi:WD40 repeat protein